jgi:hypothetical protein
MAINSNIKQNNKAIITSILLLPVLVLLVTGLMLVVLV